MFANGDRYHQWAQVLSDEEWCEFLAGTPIGGHIPPPLPPEEFQRAWVGAAGLDAIHHAMDFCRLLKSALADAGYELTTNSRVLDIGVGWGRIYRVLLRETPNIIGTDIVQQCIELCRSALPGGQFELSPSVPPYRFSDRQFDITYLYSVFSHLNEPMFLALLHEAARVVRGGGFVAFTTLRGSDSVLQSIGFPETWKAEAEAGRFLYVPTGGGHENMPASDWGWALVSKPYLQRIMSDFPLKLVAYEPDRLVQAFVVLEKR